MIFDIKMETLPREELEALQLRRLQNICQKVVANVPFYQKQFQSHGITPKHIKSLKDLHKLPFTEKQHLRDHYPYGLFATPRENIVRLHASSGTTGKVTVVGYTQRDIDNWSELMARLFAAAGVTGSDLIHNAYGYGLFTGGLGAHYGAERLGATVVPISGGATKKQIQFMRDLGATVLCCTPSYALHLCDAAAEEGLDFKDKRVLALKTGIFGAEPWSEEMRANIESKMGIAAMNCYGLSEIMGPGVAAECLQAKNGLHIFEDHFLPEIIDPITGESLEYGQEGELVITTLTKEAIPLIRYRTRDITSLNPVPCKCGRTHLRMNRIAGRSDDMLIIRGVNVYPSQIEAILVETEGLAPHYQILVKREQNLDTIEIQVEVSEELLFKDSVKDLQKKSTTLSSKLKEFLGLSAKVSLVEPKTIARSEGKAKRIIDLRKEQKN